MKISVAIITFNEERNIDRCLASVQAVADEIIVVDSLSTDATEAICQRWSVRFIKEPFRGYVEQKNFANQQCGNQWVLSLDADEALSEELQASILRIKEQPDAQAYWMNRKTNYCGTWINHSGWYPDRKIRLFDKSCAQWGGHTLHEKIVLKMNTKQLQLSGDLLHYSYYSQSQHVIQTEKFSTLAAEAAFKNGKKASILKVILNPFFTFLKKYFLQFGILDGYAGFLIAIHSAYGKFLKYAKLHELHRQSNA